MLFTASALLVYGKVSLSFILCFCSSNQLQLVSNPTPIERQLFLETVTHTTFLPLILSFIIKHSVVKKWVEHSHTVIFRNSLIASQSEHEHWISCIFWLEMCQKRWKRHLFQQKSRATRGTRSRPFRDTARELDLLIWTAKFYEQISFHASSLTLFSIFRTLQALRRVNGARRSSRKWYLYTLNEARVSR